MRAEMGSPWSVELLRHAAGRQRKAAGRFLLLFDGAALVSHVRRSGRTTGKFWCMEGLSLRATLLAGWPGAASMDTDLLVVMLGTCDINTKEVPHTRIDRQKKES